MSNSLTNQYEPDLVSPPGETLAEILEERQMTKTQFAERTGRTPKFIIDIIKGRASITPTVAIEFQRVLGIPNSFWDNRQRHYEAFIAQKREAQSLAEKLTWANNFPYNEMSKKQWIVASRNKLDRLTNILDFFGVATPDAWNDVWHSLPVKYRKSERVSSDEYALAAWLCRGEHIARTIECNDYDRTRFQGVLAEIRDLTVKTAEEFVPELTRMCSSCGVAVAFVPELPKTASGATRWLSPTKALIQLSLRYKSNDHLWFTFFHEAAHILYHGKRLIFIESGKYDSIQEREANRFAENILIPPDDINTFLYRHPRGNISDQSVIEFANSVGIDSGIVVGRLQKENRLKRFQGNNLKRKLQWASAT